MFRKCLVEMYGKSMGMISEMWECAQIHPMLAFSNVIYLLV